MDRKSILMNDERRLFDCCVRCGICLGSCPVYKITRQEVDSPRGRLEIMRAFAENKAISPDEMRHYLSSCLFCLQCQNNCSAGVEFDLCFFLSMGRIMEKEGGASRDIVYPRGLKEQPLSSAAQVGHWMDMQTKRSDQGQGISLIFPGCFVSWDEMEHIRTYLIDKGTDVLLPPERICCALPFFLQGDLASALGYIKQNIEFFNRLDIRTVFTPCPFCLKVLRRYYSIFLGSKTDIEFKHVSDSLTYEDLKPAWEKGKKVAYHTSCLLDETTAHNHRKMIKCLAGDSFIDIPGQICCGYGFGPSSKKAEILSKEICRKGLSKMAERGVQCLITDCPSCMARWKDGIAQGGWDIEVVPFWQLALHKK